MDTNAEKIILSAREPLSRHGARALEARENVEIADRSRYMRAKHFAILVLTEVERAAGS